MREMASSISEVDCPPIQLNAPHKVSVRRIISTLNMHSRFLRRFIFLYLTLLTAAHPQAQKQSGSWTLGLVDDWVSSGNYLIYSCGSQATSIKDLLDLTYLYLQTAILSTNAPAYRAFFRTADPASATTLLTTITAGTNITTRRHGSKRPVLVCANESDLGIRSLWKLCQERTGTPWILPPGAAVVVLCPMFFKWPLSPQSDQCATVNHASTALVQKNGIAANQYSMLVFTLADLYMREKLSLLESPGGNIVFENACLELSPDQALKNPTSYMFFVSSECQLLLFSPMFFPSD